MEIDRLIQALVQSENEAADDALLEGLRVGAPGEQAVLLRALLKRATVHGLSGVVGLYVQLPEALQKQILASVKMFHQALRESGRSENPALRISAMRVIAQGRQGKLAYVLSENLRSEDPDVSKAAIECLGALARWVSNQAKWLMRGEYLQSPEARNSDTLPPEALAAYQDVLTQRPEIESAVVKAIDQSRGKNGPELLRAALLLCDWPGSKTLSILQTAKHGGQTAMVRRLEQPPASEHVEAFLLAASHAQLRSQFAVVFAHITEAPVLDALLRRTHWLKDTQLQQCMQHVTRGAWWGESELLEDASTRGSDQASRIGDWLAASGAHDVIQDDRMDRLRVRSASNFGARLRLLRLAAQRRRGSSVQFLKQFMNDSDERLVRMAARELVRRRPPEYEGLLLSKMSAAPPSARRIIARALGHIGFEQFWERYEQLDAVTRTQAGRAIMKILPDSAARLKRRLNSGPVEDRIKAMQMAHDLGLVAEIRHSLTTLLEHANPRVRSKAISVLAELPDGAGELLLERVLHDGDPRVRANAVQMLEAIKNTKFVPLLTEKARGGQNRERANAIKALHRLGISPPSHALMNMLNDQRPEHRVSALWALKKMGFWTLLQEVGRLAKEDSNIRVRRYALGVLKEIMEIAEQERGKAG